MRRTSARVAQLRQHLDRVKWRDKQAVETYNLLREALPTTKYVLCDYDAQLREYYRADRINELAFGANPFFEFTKALRKTGRELSRTVYCYATEHCPPDRAYIINKQEVGVITGLSDWLPSSESAKTEEAMPTIEHIERDVKIRTKSPSKEYRDNWERIFGGENTEDPIDAPELRACTGFYDDGVMPTRCQNREGCGLAGCPAADFGNTFDNPSVTAR